MFRQMIIAITVIFSMWSQAQLAFDEETGAFLVCSSYRNEIAQYGLPVYNFNDKYCIFIKDDSFALLEQILGNVSLALINGSMSVIRVVSGEGIFETEDVTNDALKQDALLKKDSKEITHTADIHSRNGKAVNGDAEVMEQLEEEMLEAAREARRKCDEVFLEAMLAFWGVDESPWDEGCVK